MVEIVHVDNGSIGYFKGSEMVGMTPEPYPTFDPNGNIPAVYNYVYNTIFGSSGQIRDRDALNTLASNDPNIVGTEQDMFEHNNYAVYVQATIMSDGSRWFDLSGDGKPETHIKLVTGGLAYDSDLNGTFDVIF